MTWFIPVQSALLQIGVKECLISLDASVMDVKKVRDVFARCDVVLTEKKKSFVAYVGYHSMRVVSHFPCRLLFWQ